MSKLKSREWQKIEQALSSKGRLRILKKLAENGPSTKYALQKYTGLKPRELKRQLNKLVETGLVQETSYKPKKYTINTENPFAAKIAKLLKKTSQLLPPAPKHPPPFKNRKPC